MKKSTQSSRYCQGDKLCSQRFNKGAATLFLTVLLAFFNGLYSGAALAFTEGAFVSTTLEGCRNDGTITLPISGKFVCPDSVYTTGNLGKGWNELDLVPHRLTTSLGTQSNATTDYGLYIAGDGITSGKIGWDVISVPVVNLALSDASCSVSAGSQLTLGDATTPFGGGTDTVIYRELTIHQNKGTTCVFDYYKRLALGSHLYPGSSLQSYLFDQVGLTGGKKTISIPVKEILPQSISKDMTATQNSTHAWNITKGPQDASVSFGDVCAVDQDFKESLKITVSWTKVAAIPGGPITIITHVYGTNPAARTITTNVTDVIKSGTTVLNTSATVTTDVPANTANFLLMTDTFVAPAGSTDLNDVATATYTDNVTGVPIPGTTTATASATVQTGTTLNGTATITDIESITGTGLSYSTDSFFPVIGSFSGGYIAGTETTGSVTWVSDLQSGDGSVEFNKTLYLDGKQATSGVLSDTATLLGSDGFTASASASVNISSSASVKLTVEKAIPQSYADDLDTGERLEVAFHVGRLSDPSYSQDFTLTFGPGEALKTTSFDGLVPDEYVVTEVSATFFAVGDPNGVPANLVPTGGDSQNVKINLPACSGTANFVNAPGTDQPVRAQVQKITEPELLDTDPDYNWTFTLSGPNVNEVILAGANAGNVLFDAFLDEGDYTITETGKPGWDLISVQPSGDIATKVCNFSVNLPQDEGKTFGCSFKNVKRGTATVNKTQSGSLPLSKAFEFEIRKGASLASSGTLLATGSSDINTGVVNFTCLITGAPDCVNVSDVANLVPGDYQLCEINMLPGWANNLAGFTPNGELNSTECVNFILAAGDTKVFNVDNTPPAGGDARTIGYWKNWSSCDGHGNQDPVLDETLAKAGGIYIGILLVDTCEEGVAILDKRTLTGKKMASDPAFGLAAQLLAAKLNIVAGAKHCAAADTAISSGQSLLATILFNGNTHNTMTAAQKTLANRLAGTLDKYNNNTLCP